MTQHDDQQLVDYLFDELSEEEATNFEHLLEEDTALDAEVSSLEDTLGVMRELEAEDPPQWLSSKVMAEARQVAEESQKDSLFDRLRKFMWGPAGGLVGAGAVAVVLAVFVTPQMVMENAAPTADQLAYEMGARELEAPPGVPSAAPAKSAASGEVSDLEERADLAPDSEPSVIQDGLLAKEQPTRSARAQRGPKTETAKLAKAGKKRRARRSRSPRGGRAEAAPSDDLSIGDLGAMSGVGASGQASGGGGLGTKATAAAPTAAAPAQPRPAVQAAPAKPQPKAKPSRSFEPPPPAEAPAADEDAFADGKAKAEKKKDANDSRANPRQYAQDMVRAAREELRRGEVGSARRVLIQAAQRLSAHPARGWIFVERGRLELNHGDLGVARRYAQAALDVADFEGYPAARSLLNEIQRAQSASDAPAPAAPPADR